MDFSRLKRFDVYPKTIQDYQVKTVGGAFVSMCGLFLMGVLFFGELNMYLTTSTAHEMAVDTTRGQKVQINLNITFPSMPCSVISLDTMDIAGEQHIGVSHEMYKQRLDSSGRAVDVAQREHEIHSNKTHIDHVLSEAEKHAQQQAEKKGSEVAAASGDAKCGSCYGAEENLGDCCNTCEEVKSAYRLKGWAIRDMSAVEQCSGEENENHVMERDHEGCIVHGKLEVNKVAGNFHFAPGKSISQVIITQEGLISFTRKAYNVSHVINHLSFGHKYPGRVNPLDGVERYTQDKNSMHQYFLKVVPTTYQYLNRTVIETHQFATTENQRKLDGFSRGLPGVFFFYDLSPIMVTFRENRNSFLHFLTGVCAIVGGVFTVAGLLDSSVYAGQKLAAKMRMGKQF